jgi:hypothetical protein
MLLQYSFQLQKIVCPPAYNPDYGSLIKFDYFIKTIIIVLADDKKCCKWKD